MPGSGVNYTEMEDTKRIKKLFENLYQGNPWIETTIIGALQNISAEQAAVKLMPQWNSIWEIVNHLISWRLNVLQRIQGIIVETPDDNYFSRQTDISNIAWQNTLKKLEVSQHAWIAFLEELNEEELDKIYPVNNLSYYEHIQGIIQHDAYHLGQIVLLAKHIRSAEQDKIL